MRVCHDARAGSRKRLRNEEPDIQSTHDEDGIWNTIRRHCREPTENDSEHDCVEYRLQQRPSDADHGLLITDLQATPHKYRKKMAKRPDLRKLEHRLLRYRSDQECIGVSHGQGNNRPRLRIFCAIQIGTIIGKSGLNPTARVRALADFATRPRANSIHARRAEDRPCKPRNSRRSSWVNTGFVR